MNSTILQALLVVQIFVLGVLATYAAQYWRRHKAASSLESQPLHHPGQQTYAGHEEGMPEAVRQRLVQESELRIENSLNRTASKLDRDLEASAVHINQLVNKLASDIVGAEMQRYRVQLGKLHEHANTEMGAISGQISQHEAEIKARIAQELALEKQRLVKQIDTKLADAVGSFLNETLQHNIDLGNQTEYLMAMLEQHKQDFIKEVGADEVQPKA